MIVKQKAIIVASLFVLISFVCVAQGGLNGPPAPTPPPPGLPIDGGLCYGMVFALFYGVRKLWVKRGE